MTADALADRREEKSRRRTDAIAMHPATRSKQCPPHAALLHRVASLITTEDLPLARVTVDHSGVTIDTSGCELVENAVRRYASALELVVVEVPAETVGGFAALMWDASGYDGTGTWWHVVGTQLLPTPIVDRFGVGLVQS